MAFTEGNTYGQGRPKGATNKTTSELRSLISEFVSNGWAQLVTDFPTLPAEDRVNILVKFLPYIVPKLTPIEAPAESPTATRQELIREFLSRIPTEELMKAIDEIKDANG